jgi:hypothetical protein
VVVVIITGCATVAGQLPDPAGSTTAGSERCVPRRVACVDITPARGFPIFVTVAGLASPGEGAERSSEWCTIWLAATGVTDPHHFPVHTLRGDVAADHEALGNMATSVSVDEDDVVDT